MTCIVNKRTELVDDEHAAVNYRYEQLDLISLLTRAQVTGVTRPFNNEHGAVEIRT